MRCDSTAYVSTVGKVRCDLKAGHDGLHQWGGSQIYAEWYDAKLIYVEWDNDAIAEERDRVREQGESE